MSLPLNVRLFCAFCHLTLIFSFDEFSIKIYSQMLKSMTTDIKQNKTKQNTKTKTFSFALILNADLKNEKCLKRMYF